MFAGELDGELQMQFIDFTKREVRHQIGRTLDFMDRSRRGTPALPLKEAWHEAKEKGWRVIPVKVECCR